MSTDWKAELERIGVTLPLAPRDETRRLAAMETENTDMPWIVQAQKHDSTIVDPRIPNRKEYEIALEQYEENLGPIGDFLYNNGVTHVASPHITAFGDTQDHDTLNNAAGYWRGEDNLAISRPDYLQVFNHEVGHALSEKLMTPLNLSMPEAAEAAVKAAVEDVKELPEEVWMLMAGSDSQNLRHFASPQPNAQHWLEQRLDGALEITKESLWSLEPDVLTLTGEIQNHPELLPYFPKLNEAIENHAALTLLDPNTNFQNPIKEISEHPILLDAIRADFDIIFANKEIYTDKYLRREGVEDVYAYNYLPTNMGGRHPTLTNNLSEEIISQLTLEVLENKTELSAFMPNTRAETEGMINALNTPQQEKELYADMDVAPLDVSECTDIDAPSNASSGKSGSSICK